MIQKLCNIASVKAIDLFMFQTQLFGHVIHCLFVFASLRSMDVKKPLDNSTNGFKIAKDEDRIQEVASEQSLEPSISPGL